MRAERHSLFIHSSQLVQAENLESAGVGQDRTPPRHKPVQSPHLSDSGDSRPQVKVIGIAKDDLRAEFFERLLRDTFHRRHRAHRHEYWSFDHGVRSSQPSEAGIVAYFLNVERSRHALRL